MGKSGKVTCVCGHPEFEIIDGMARDVLKPKIICTKCGDSWTSGYDAEPYASSKFARDKRTIFLGRGGVVVRDLRENAVAQ